MNTNFQEIAIRRPSVRLAALAVAAGSLLAAPAGAGAHFATTVQTVQSHTDRADAALERAGVLFDRARERKAARAFNRSRSEMRKANAEAGKLRREAGTESELVEAALARQVVAAQQDENVEELVGLLDEAEGRVENRIAQAALTDTRGRDKAIAILRVLLAELPEQAQAGIGKALVALSTDRSGEVKAEARALTSDDVSKRSKRRVATAVEANVEGQQVAADKLRELIESEDTPDAAKQGLQTAYDAVTGDQRRAAKVLTRFSDRMPASIRTFVAGIVQQAQENAQAMADNRPTPPAGQPEGTPTGAPAGTPAG